MWDRHLTVRCLVDHTDTPYRTDLGDAQSWMFTEGQTNWQSMGDRALLGELFTDVSLLLMEVSMSRDFELTRGVIYVMRQVAGEEVPLALCAQRSYAEWVGCFSAI